MRRTRKGGRQKLAGKMGVGKEELVGGRRQKRKVGFHRRMHAFVQKRNGRTAGKD